MRRPFILKHHRSSKLSERLTLTDDLASQPVQSSQTPEFTDFMPLEPHQASSNLLESDIPTGHKNRPPVTIIKGNTTGVLDLNQKYEVLCSLELLNFRPVYGLIGKVFSQKTAYNPTTKPLEGPGVPRTLDGGTNLHRDCSTSEKCEENLGMLTAVKGSSVLFMAKALEEYDNGSSARHNADTLTTYELLKNNRIRLGYFDLGVYVVSISSGDIILIDLSRHHAVKATTAGRFSVSTAFTRADTIDPKSKPVPTQVQYY